MDRRKQNTPNAPMTSCAVCGEEDKRMLAIVQLRGGEEATLCGSHALMHARSKEDIRTEDDLRNAFSNRRSGVRRAAASSGDELADKLQAAFTRERRSVERRSA
jgi:hypothetical protein